MTGTHLWAGKRMVTPERRVKDDFYPTPPECVTALLPYIADFPQSIWEPACGDGAIATVLRSGPVDRNVIQTDLCPRTKHAGAMDFLLSKNALAPAIITNPPYNLAEAFIRKSFALKINYLALLLKANFWSSYRHGLFEDFPPSVMMPLTWRPDFTGKGKPFLEVSWNVWRLGGPVAKIMRLMRP